MSLSIIKGHKSLREGVGKITYTEGRERFSRTKREKGTEERKRIVKGEGKAKTSQGNGKKSGWF